ncbi:NACHT domain-containing protein [Mycoavidus sp. SF9855]|uniref:NACHT domain-containing protein n=1 Tax=Mycoavidus sp. SF9855 TaxID=2968475 RepID=UPI00211C116F|nr:NACHT domain-containing protein [Mycoavidus sp. SF9855]UUM20896.1 NACHT domain-containing protein [Mycoavidus sp. SF9855]
MPLQRQAVVLSSQGKSELADYLFEMALSTLESLELSNKPSLFLVYAHDNPKYPGQAGADTSKYLIEKLSQIRVNLYSDQTPMGQPYSSSPEKLKKDGKLEDILTSQLCLLPVQLRDDVEPVDKVVVCCSKLLGKYLEWPHYEAFYQQLQEAYRQDLEQRSTLAIREVVRKFSQEQEYKVGFHHVLTEVAFLQIRTQHLQDHSIIPVSYTPDSYEQCLGRFIQSTTVRMGDISRFAEQTKAGEMYPNQGQHIVLFKLIERLLVDSDKAKPFLNKFWQGYNTCISRLNDERSTLDALEFAKLLNGIFGDIWTELHKKIFFTAQQFCDPTWQQVGTQLLDQSRNLTHIQTGLDLLVEKLLGNLQKNIQKLRERYLEGLQQDREIKDALANYVALEGAPVDRLADRFDLESKVHDYLNSDKKVLLLLGDAGSGKSTFNRRLAVSLWEAYPKASTAENAAIPVFIGLSSLKSPNQNLVSTFFKSRGFSEEQIKGLQENQSFVFILDGYDELEDRHRWFYKDNQLGDWKKAKIIISSRPEYLGSSYQYKFHPSGELTSLQEYQLAPFSSETIEQYVNQYKKAHPEGPWSTEQYKEALKQPDLKELVGNPFLLKITLSVLPELSKKLQEKSQHFTRIGLYDEFVKSWFSRSQQRLAQIQLNPEEVKEFRRLEQNGFVERGVGFSKKLAAEMYQAGEVISTYLAEADDPWEGLSVELSHDWRKRLLGNESAMTVLMRFNAPLIRQGDQYRFIHKSLQDYFVARALWEELNAYDKVEPYFWLNTLNIASDPAILQFLAERVWHEPKLEAQLLSVVDQSKEEEGVQFEIGAANALTVLVKAGVQLTNKDFDGIRVQGADLSYGIFDHTQFQGADLRRVNWTGAWLKGANLNGADLEGLDLGEKPALNMEYPVSACCYSPDGRWFTVIADKYIYLYDAESLQKIHTYVGHREPVTSIAFSVDGQWLASGSKDNRVRLWTALGNRSLVRTYIGHKGPVTSIAFSIDGQWLASGGEDNKVKLWSVLGDRLPIHTYVGHEDTVNSVAFSANGQWLASGSNDITKLWSISGERTLMHTYVSKHFKIESVKCVAFSLNSLWLAFGGGLSYTVRLYSVTGKRALVHTYAGHGDTVNSIAFSADGQWLASGSDDCTIKLWSVLGERHLMHTYIGHQMRVKSVAFSADNQWLVSGSDDKSVKLWSVMGKRYRLNTYAEHKVNNITYEDIKNCIALSADGQWLASGSECGMVNLWHVSGDRSLARTYTGHKDSVSAIAFSSDGQWLASGSWGGVRLWHVLGDRSLAHTYTVKSIVNSIAFSSDGQWLAFGSWDRTVKLWHVSGDRSLVHTYIGHEAYVNCVMFSPNGQWLASASGNDENTVKLWSVLGKRTLVNTYAGHSNSVKTLVFSADSRWLASGCYSGKINLWSIGEKGFLYHTYKDRGVGGNSIAFSDDGKLLISGGGDETIRIWSVYTGECLAVLQAPGGSVCNIVWHLSLDGAAIFVTVGENKVVRWSVLHDVGQTNQIILKWASRQDALTATGAWIKNARNLSPQNELLLGQCGAGRADVGENAATFFSQSSNEIFSELEYLDEIYSEEKSSAHELSKEEDSWDTTSEEKSIAEEF